MEYVNINSLSESEVSEQEKKELISRYSPSELTGFVVTTDALEIIQGHELIQSARQTGVDLLPLRRISRLRSTKHFPKRVLLELTSKCNSYCTMCPRNVLTREERHMDVEVAKRAITQLAEVGISGLWLYNIGESLLHPDFFEILSYCRKFDTLGTIWLSTNGEIMSSSMRGKILENPVDILNYSVNAMSIEGYKQIAPTLRFEKVHKNLKALVSERINMGSSYPILRAQMIEIPAVKNEIESFKLEYGKLVDILSINKLEEFSQNVEQNPLDREGSLNKSIDVCNRLDREDFFIFSDGSVSCCDTDFNCNLNIGNVNSQTIQEIYNGEPYRALIRQYKNGRLHENPLCAKCMDFNL